MYTFTLFRTLVNDLHLYTKFLASNKIVTLYLSNFFLSMMYFQYITQTNSNIQDMKSDSYTLNEGDWSASSSLRIIVNNTELHTINRFSFCNSLFWLLSYSFCLTCCLYQHNSHNILWQANELYKALLITGSDQESLYMLW